MKILDEFESDKFSDFANKKETIPARNIYADMQIGMPVVYQRELKRYTFSTNVTQMHIGFMLSYNESSNTVDALYKGFLLKDPVEINSNINPIYIQTYLEKTFQRVNQALKDNMPRIKKLKRINAKMLTRHHVNILYNNFNNIIDYYRTIYGYEKAEMFKAAIVTTPFYINDDGVIKLYDFSSNELTIPDEESSGNFLAYFTFHC